jgi:ligand-binding sensor domain-containing protein/signal transduction histidine kinase
MRGCEFKSGSSLRAAAALLGLLSASVVIRGEQLPIKHYTTSDGLPSTSILRIVRDSRGFLWFCTRDGLSRFDGYRFVNYATKHGLPIPTINDLLETRSGVYWVATNGEGICRFSPSGNQSQGRAELFSVFSVSDQVWGNRVNVLYEDHSGRLWAGTDGGLFVSERVDPNPVFSRVELNKKRALARGVWRLIEDREGSIWISTTRGLVRRLPGGEMVDYAVAPLPSSGVVPLLLDREGRLWFGSQQGLFVLKPQPASQVRDAEFKLRKMSIQSAIRNSQSILLPEVAGEFRRFTPADGLPDSDATDLHQSVDGRIWIATVGGLAVFDGTSFRAYTTAHGLTYGVRYLSEDLDGNLWMGSSGDGAMKLALNGLTAFGEADGLGRSTGSPGNQSALNIRAIYEGISGSIFAVSSPLRAWKGWCSINLLDGARFRSVHPSLPAGALGTGFASQAGFLDQTGRWWLLTTKGLLRFPTVRRIEDLRSARPAAVYTARDWMGDERQPYRLFEDSHGDIWVWGSGAKRGLAKWKRATETWEPLPKPDGVSADDVAVAFCEDRSGSVWIGLQLGGLVRYKGDQGVLLSAKYGLPIGGITDLYPDREGHIWIGSSQDGLGRIDDLLDDRPEFVVYTTDQGLSSNNIRCITEDLNGRIYIGTARGVDQINPATWQVRHFTTNDGLANDFVTVAFRDRRGVLWFGTSGGLSRFQPAPDTSSTAPPVWIASLDIAGNPLPISELGEIEVRSLELDTNQNQIQIEFFGLGFKTGERLRYQVKLEGSDNDWSDPTSDRTIKYASLQPGKYRFLVRALSADGLVSETPAVVDFRILPPVWQRWWFLTIAAVAGVAAVYGAHRYRVSNIIKLERVRTRIATDLHDDIGASLSRVAILSEVIKQRLAPVHKEADRRLTEIAETARGLVDSMSDIVWSTDPRRDDLQGLVFRLREFAYDVLESRGIRFDFSTPPGLHRVRLGPEQRGHLFLILKEAINNIARHADCSSASVAIGITRNQLLAEIQDDGCGFDLSSNWRDGHGLKNMLLRAEQIGGLLNILSAPGEGTRLTLRVPLKRRGA